MSADIVNLRRARKRRERAEAAERAAKNRVQHGQPKPVRDLARARREQEQARLDGHRRDRQEEPPGSDRS